MFQELVIEEWNPKLNGSRHRHLIALEKKILRQPDLHVGVEHLVQCRLGEAGAAMRQPARAKPK